MFKHILLFFVRVSILRVIVVYFIFRMIYFMSKKCLKIQSVRNCRVFCLSDAFVRLYLAFDLAWVRHCRTERYSDVYIHVFFKIYLAFDLISCDNDARMGFRVDV